MNNMNQSTTDHWLRRLLAPKRIAIVGISSRPDNLATITYQQLVSTGFDGQIDFINPRQTQIFDTPCYPDLAALPQVPDLVVYGISGPALEASFDQAMALQVGGVLIYASNQFEGDHPPLPTRLAEKAQAANIPVFGGNSMGFYNYDDGVMVSFDHPPKERPPGHIGLITHSGSAMTYLANNDARFCYNYVFATGQEINATVADYIDYLLEQASTRVIAIFLEAIRDVDGFICSLEKAQQQKIPIVITKLGRTQKSAELALSHSGALVGNHDAFVALCERYGVVLTRDTDEMMITALLLSMDRRPSLGGVSSLLDSGGMRELMIDLADDHGLPLAPISSETKHRLAQHLEYGLAADNPLDAMGALGRNTESTYLECGKALLDDPQTALLTFEFEFRDGFSHYPVLFDVARSLRKHSEKPVILINSSTYTSLNDTAAKMTHEGLITINGIDVALRSLKHFLRFSERQTQATQKQTTAPFDRQSPYSLPADFAAIHNQLLNLIGEKKPALSEEASLELARGFELPVVDHEWVDNMQSARAAANRLGYPIVLKTAAHGIHHKSDQGGVILNLGDEVAVMAAYEDLDQRLGPQVLVMPMITEGIEISLGMKHDVQYGALIVLAAGGILIDSFDDRAIGLAPITLAEAGTMIEQLRIAPLLKGVRGQSPADRIALEELIVRFSYMALALTDVVDEIDFNPIKLTPKGCAIVDGLVILQSKSSNPSLP